MGTVAAMVASEDVSLKCKLYYGNKLGEICEDIATNMWFKNAFDWLVFYISRI